MAVGRRSDMSRRPMLLFALAMAWQAAAQPARAPQTPNSTLVSPEVMPDHTVVFRLYASKASEVTLTGDWMSGTDVKSVPLVKNEEGVWSVTAGPLTPDVYA